MEINGIGGVPDIGAINTVKNKAVDDSFDNRLNDAIKRKDGKELKKVCKEFESTILNMLYKSMKSTVPKSDLIPRSVGRDIIESMMDEELVKEASKKGGFGLAEMLYKQIKSAYNIEDGGE
jgi:flagellar protein FlgJ